MTGRLETDRYGVPQYSGASETFEEYEERAWDLWYGRAGQEQLQTATPVHLRAGLTGSAWESVRKLKHDMLITKAENGSPTTDGMKLLLKTLRDAIADEVPVKINELFLTAFYSPSVWRRNNETMQQYIIRRELDFKKLEETSPETKVSNNIRAMMLLIFGGLDAKEQVSVLSSCGNQYDFEKISHAMRLLFPNAAGKPVQRRDFLGSGGGRTMSSQSSTLKAKWRTKKHFAMAMDDESQQPDDGEEAYGDDAYYEDDENDTNDEILVADSDEELLDSFVQEIPDLGEDDSSLAEAYATVLQHKQKKRNASKGKGKGSGKSFNFKASGEMSFDAKAKENRKQAVQFLKSVTPCTSCGQRGHWQGDDVCPNSKRGSGRKPGHWSQQVSRQAQVFDEHFGFIFSEKEASFQLLRAT